MPDPFANYDAWLSRGYERRAEEDDRYLRWCEEHDLNPEDDASAIAWEDETAYGRPREVFDAARVSRYTHDA